MNTAKSFKEWMTLTNTLEKRVNSMSLGSAFLLFLMHPLIHRSIRLTPINLWTVQALRRVPMEICSTTAQRWANAAQIKLEGLILLKKNTSKSIQKREKELNTLNKWKHLRVKELRLNIKKRIRKLDPIHFQQFLYRCKVQIH